VDLGSQTNLRKNGINMILIKQLTKSDLTIIERFWSKKLKQEAIVIGKHYIETLDPKFKSMKRSESIAIDLEFYGPNDFPVIHRPSASIGKQPNDWRIQSCSIKGAEDDPSRFSGLKEKECYFLFNLVGSADSYQAIGVFLSPEFDDDILIINEIDNYGNKSLSPDSIRAIVSDLSLDEDHCLYKLISDSARSYNISPVELSVDGKDITTVKREAFQTQEQLDKKNSDASRVGLAGETLFDEWLASKPLFNRKVVFEHEWLASHNAVSPYDFKIVFEDESEVCVELKTTEGEYNNNFYISSSELRKMVSGDVSIVRMYNLNGSKASFKICSDTRTNASEILEKCEFKNNLVSAQNFKIDPEYFNFSNETYQISGASD
jgi:hypothetical protein